MESSILIKSTVGIHAELASKIVQVASKYDAQLNLIYEDKVVNAKSILGLMSLAVPSGTNLTLKATGNEAVEAIKAVQKILL